MKKSLLILLVLMFSFSAVVSAADTGEDTDTAAATFAIEEAQDYKSPVTSRTYYKSGNTVTYDDKSVKELIRNFEKNIFKFRDIKNSIFGRC